MPLFVRIIADNPVFKKTCKSLEAFEELKPEEKDKVQFEKLKETLVYADKYVPYYRKLFKKCGFEPGKMVSVKEIEKFEEFVNKSPNVKYCGVFDSTKSSVYKKLNEYDILLFPTHWKGEGVPGILVEAKMAGLAVIASPMNFNAEIIREDNKEGFLLEKDYAVEMAEIIKKCAENRELLKSIKEESYKSRKRYSINEYEKMLEKI